MREQRALGAPSAATESRAGATLLSGPHPRVTEHHIAVDIDIPSDVNEIEPAVSLVTALCRGLRLPGRQCTLNVPVALSEALSNAIIQGNHEDPSKHVHLRATVSDVALVLDVSDEGAGFDMQSVSRDPTTPEHIEREHGRGLFLMHQLMDRVEQINGSPHVLRLTLNR